MKSFGSPRASVLVALYAAAAACSACSSTETTPPVTNNPPVINGDASVTPDAGSVQVDPPKSDPSLVKDRPYTLKVPTKYDASKPTPLVVLLHGYTASGSVQESYFKLGPQAEARTFLYVTVDGRKDSQGNRFWAATDGCCNFYGSEVDDVAYLTAVMDDVAAKYNVDAKRTFIVGHSNGGFMAHRLGCELSGRIAAVVSLAGANYKDASKCKATSPVSVLQVHGDKDETIAYEGGSVSPGAVPEFPSAHETVATWAKIDGCSSALTDTTKTVDVDSQTAGPETKVEAYSGCKSSTAVELWTIPGGIHTPKLASGWSGLVFDFLAAHPKN